MLCQVFGEVRSADDLVDFDVHGEKPELLLLFCLHETFAASAELEFLQNLDQAEEFELRLGLDELLVLLGYEGSWHEEVKAFGYVSGFQAVTENQGHVCRLTQVKELK